MLLWHGSGLENILGILADGLCIAPVHAKLTGSMFGKGIYFADAFVKSRGYCSMGSYGSVRARNHCVAFLCRVAVGTSKVGEHCSSSEQRAANHAARFHSTFGPGYKQPDPTKAIVIASTGVKIPMGPLVRPDHPNLMLSYNEYVVYDPTQVCIEYAVLLKNKGWTKTPKAT
eukprot:Opistho-2@84921